MTTYTKISDDERPSISIDPNFTIAEINDNVYGGFTEYATSNVSRQHPVTDASIVRKDTWGGAFTGDSTTQRTLSPTRMASGKMSSRL